MLHSELPLPEWKGTEHAVPSGTVPGLFSARVAESPRATAVVSEDGVLSYAELDVRANRLAHRLVRLGVGPEDRVAVLLDRSVSVVVAELAVVKAAGVYVPLDVRAPAERLRFVLAESGATVLLTDHVWESTARSVHQGPVLVVDDSESLSDEPVDPPRVTVVPESLAYVMFTSGSTGVPKGVGVRHCDVVALAFDRCFAGHESVLLHSPLAFDATTYELWVPLLNGGRVVVAPPGELDFDTLERVLTTHSVTALWLTAGLFRLLAQDSPGCLAGVREVWTGGDVVPAAAVRRVMEVCPGLVVVDGYGPTETTTFAAHHVMSTGDEVPDVVPIGRPLDNMRLYVLDENLRPVAPGAPGELFIAGAGLARGYLDRPGLTAERFVANPFDDAGSRMYWTGDVVRWNDQGELLFVGRADDQVKIRGFRVEPGEVEVAIAGLEGVGEAVVVVREDQPAAKRLVAYVVPTPGAVVDPASLRESVTDRLPDYMVPSTVVVLDTLPLTANGKVDRSALPEPSRNGSRYVAPRNEIEQIVAGIWADVLGVERVGVEDDFLELGGDSILSVRLMSRLRNTLEVDLPTRTIFDAPTVAGLVELLPDRRAAQDPDLITPVPRGDVLPLSFAQQRLWFLDGFNPGGVEYYTGVGMRLAGELDPHALRAALDALVARHESLRTTFDEVDGRGVQIVHPAGELPLRHADVSQLPDAALDEVLHTEVATPFDLHRGPLVRALLVRLSDAEHVLVLSQHHIITDGWSVRLLVEEFEALYADAVRGRESGLSTPPIQYADYAVWNREHAGDDQLDFWRQKLAGLAPLELPTDRPRPPVRRSVGAVHRHDLPAGLVEELARLGQAHGATLFMTLTAATNVLLSRYSGQQDIALGTVTAGRDRAELEKVAGFFINTLVLRSQVDPARPFTGFLAETRETVLEAFAHNEVPFDRLVDALAPERDPSRAPLVQALVVMQDALVRPRTVEGLRVSEHDLPRIAARFDLLIEFWPVDGSLAVKLEYNTDLFDASTIERMAVHLETMLAGVIATPEQSLAELPMVPDAELELVLRAWNDTATGDHDRTVPDLFAEWVRQAPGAVAVVSDHGELSYAELDVASNRLAHRLVRLGVTAERPVALLLDRSVDLVVAELAVVKAGGAYVPLDVRAPAERMRALLDQIGVSVVLTDRGWAPTARTVHDGHIVVVDDDRSLSDEPADAPRVTVWPESLAYVMYTSGSTGVPKGVAVRHCDVVALALDRCFAGHESVLLHSPLAFDATTFELWVPLLNGGRVVVAPPGDLDFGTLERMLTTHNVTALWLTAGLFRLLAQDSPGCLAGVREVWTGGDVVPATTPSPPLSW